MSEKALGEMEKMNQVIDIILREQEDLNQPIYVIAKFWLSELNKVVKFTTEGDKDLPGLIEEFRRSFAWDYGAFGVTEQRYKLLKLDIANNEVTEILDEYGHEPKYVNVKLV